MSVKGVSLPWNSFRGLDTNREIRRISQLAVGICRCGFTESAPFVQRPRMLDSQSRDKGSSPLGGASFGSPVGSSILWGFLNLRRSAGWPDPPEAVKRLGLPIPSRRSRHLEVSEAIPDGRSTVWPSLFMRRLFLLATNTHGQFVRQQTQYTATISIWPDALIWVAARSRFSFHGQ